MPAEMTPVEQRGPGRWQVGTVTSIKRETPHVKSFRFRLPMWMPHLPGQHYDVRLTAPDGYQAGSLAGAAAWIIGLLAIFIPLCVWRYRRMS